MSESVGDLCVGVFTTLVPEDTTDRKSRDF